MSATATETVMVSVDRELLHRFVVEAHGVGDVMADLAGCYPAAVTEQLGYLACEVGQAVGFEIRGGTNADGSDVDPVTRALWTEGEARRDEILGLTREAVAS